MGSRISHSQADTAWATTASTAERRLHQGAMGTERVNTTATSPDVQLHYLEAETPRARPGNSYPPDDRNGSAASWMAVRKRVRSSLGRDLSISASDPAIS